MTGDIIKELRNKKNITQDELAKIVGVTTSMIGMYEINKRTPSPQKLDKLANYFNVSVDYLLGREISGTKDSYEFSNILNNMSIQLRVNEDLTEDEKETLLKETEEYLRFRIKKKTEGK